jgi:arginyl-tRNA synthetase
VIASFVADVATQFNQFYRDCPVLAAEPAELRAARLDLVDAARIVLHNTLSCLGLLAPREM